MPQRATQSQAKKRDSKPRSRKPAQPEPPPSPAPVQVTRAYTLRLRGDEALQRTLWETHRALNAGAEVFFDWLLTMGGGTAHQDLSVRERRLAALSWLAVETGGSSSLPVVADEEVLNRLAAILAARGAAPAEIEEWVERARYSLSATRREDALWIDRSAAFDALCRELGLKDVERARADALLLWRHIFGPRVFEAEEEAEDNAEVEEAGAVAGSAGAGHRVYHVFSHLFGKAFAGFGKERHKLFYRQEWANYLAALIKSATGMPLEVEDEDKSADADADAKKAKEAADERSPGPWLREMFAHAAERIAGWRTKMRAQEAERIVLRSADAELRMLEESAETRPACELLDALRLQRGEEMGALRQYIITERALLGWTETVAAWESCAGEEERRQAVSEAQSRSKSKWGDATLFRLLAADEYLSVWRTAAGKTRPELLRVYAEGWLARVGALRLKPVAVRHLDPYSHPVFGRFGVSRPQIIFDPGDGLNGSRRASVSLVLWDGRQARKLPVPAASLRVARELVEGNGSGKGTQASPSRRTRLAELAAGAARKEQSDGHGDGELSALAGIFAGTCAGKVLVARSALNGAHERERYLEWQLTLSVSLRPQGPWVEFSRRFADRVQPDQDRGQILPVLPPRRIRMARWRGLAFPFKRLDCETGRGGELRALPGVRVMGVDLRQRYGAACAVWRSLGTEEFNQICRAAGGAGLRVEVHPLWALVEGEGLFRRIGFDGGQSVWAQLERRSIIYLPGEKEKSRPLTAAEYAICYEIAAALDLEAPPPGAEYHRTVARLLREFRSRLRRQAERAGIACAGDEGAERRAWADEDETLRKILRALGAVIAGLGREGKKAHAFSRGGLSLARIELFEDLARAQRSFAGRPTPEEPRGRVVGEDFGSSLRGKIARLKRERVRNLAARIVGCALGENARGEAVFPHVHAIIIEDLRAFRMSGSRPRRENRNLAAWSAAAVRNALAESCQLHGLHLREETAAYTSLQDVKTGQAGLKCLEVSRRDFVENAWWIRECERAEKRLGTATASPRDRLLCWLRSLVASGEKRLRESFFLPLEEGNVLIAVGGGNLRKLHPGQNAAANIGLQSLIDTHHPSAVWRIASVWDPRKKVFRAAKPKEGDGLKEWSAPGYNGRTAFSSERVVNLWRDLSSAPLDRGRWLKSDDYWRSVETAICAALEQWARQ